MEAFENVIGYEKEKQELMQLCDMAKYPEKYAALGVRLPRGVLLHGVPGVGKTLMATELVRAMGRKVYTVRKDRGEEKFVEYISGIFAEAAQNAPSVVFLDDMDKFTERDNGGNPEEYVAVQSGIDGVKDADVFVVATANSIHSLPDSILRAGRFDRVIQVNTPSRGEAVEIVRHYLKNKKISEDVTAELVAKLMDGKSCADLESVINEAGIYAGYENKTEIGREHIIRAVLREIFEADGSVNGISDSEKSEVAYHEAGHAAVALHFNGEGVGLISIRPSSDDARGVVQLLQDEDYFYSYEKMRRRVLALLAGRAAVELKFGRVDVGAASDLKRAAAVVQRFVAAYGVSGFDYLSFRGYRLVESERKNFEVVNESNAMLARMYEESKAILRAEWEFVERIAKQLVVRETLTYEDLAEICKGLANKSVQNI